MYFRDLSKNVFAQQNQVRQCSKKYNLQIMLQVQFIREEYKILLNNFYDFYLSVSETSLVFSLVSQPLTILLRKLKSGLGISFFITRHTKFFARFYGKLQRQHFDKSYFDGPFHKLYLLVEAPSALGPKAQIKCKRKETSLLQLVLYYVDVPQYGRQRMPKKA